TVAFSSLRTHEPLKPKAEACTVLVCASKLLVCAASTLSDATSRVVWPAAGPSSARNALVVLVVFVVENAAEPATRPPLPASERAKLVSCPVPRTRTVGPADLRQTTAPPLHRPWPGPVRMGVAAVFPPGS